MTVPRPTVVALLLAMLLPGCAQRGAIMFYTGESGVGSVHTVLVASTRAPGIDAASSPRTRSEELSFSRFDVSVPPNRRPGTVALPRRIPPDPGTEFLVVSAEALDGERGFAEAVDREVANRPDAEREAVVFVHGFNTNLAEGVYRHAQMRHDFRTPGVSVHYSWPSAGSVRAYAFDRESALFARDGLEALLETLTRTNVSRIVVVGHSMGAQILMETLRQMAIRGSPAFFRKLEAVVLVAPDVDIDVFRTQFRPIESAGRPVYVFVSGRDRALRFSSMLRGQSARLGSMQDLSAVSDMPITVIDVSSVDDTGDRLGHFVVATSPSMIAMISGMNDVGIAMFEDEAHSPSLFETSINAVQDVTKVVLRPLER